MSNPFFSVVIPTYNCEQYIEETINSVLNQTFKDFEILIVDDASTDNTIQKIENFKDKRIKLYINKRNQGPSYTRNRAISLSKGKWIAILDSDDLWDRKRLEVMFKNIKFSKGDIYLDNIMFFYDGEERTFLNYFKFKNIKINNTKSISIEEVLKHDLGILQPIVSREFLLSKNISYPQNIKYGEDLYFICECIAKGAKAILVNYNGYFYRNRANSLVKNKIELFDQLTEVLLLIESLFNRKNKVQIEKIISKRINEIRLLYRISLISNKELRTKKVNSECLKKHVPIKMAFLLFFSKISEKIRCLLFKKTMQTKIPRDTGMIEK